VRRRLQLQLLPCIQVSIGRQHVDSDVNLETFVQRGHIENLVSAAGQQTCSEWSRRPAFVLFLSARFIRLRNLDFVGCSQHFMHICRARHYSTLRNVHYRKRKKKKKRASLQELSYCAEDRVLFIIQPEIFLKCHIRTGVEGYWRRCCQDRLIIV